jgi:hypothetical protein
MKNLAIEYKNHRLELDIYNTPEDEGCPYTIGVCDTISFIKSGFYEDYQPVIDSFMKNVDYLTSNKLEDKIKPNSILQQYNLQLERLALKDKKDEFPPFELRRQLIEISVLFSGILDKTLEDVKKDYCDRYSKVE